MREGKCCRILNIHSESLLKLRKQTNSETEMILNVISILNINAFNDLAFATEDKIEVPDYRLFLHAIKEKNVENGGVISFLLS